MKRGRGLLALALTAAVLLTAGAAWQFRGEQGYAADNERLGRSLSPAAATLVSVETEEVTDDGGVAVGRSTRLVYATRLSPQLVQGHYRTALLGWSQEGDCCRGGAPLVEWSTGEAAVSLNLDNLALTGHYEVAVDVRAGTTRARLDGSS